MPESAPDPPRRGRPKGSAAVPWRALFQQSRTPVFVLGKGRRLRFANAAWERLTGVTLEDALGMVCSARRHSSPLAAALAPTPEALAGRPDTARRPAPPNPSGPPWWDVTFAPLADDDAPLGLVGFITVVGEPVAAASRKIPAAVQALRDRHARRFTLDLFAGPDPASERLVTQLRLAAQTTAPVWLVGEPGTGKETAARAVHHAGPRRDRAFVAIDGAGLQPFLIEGLLFGHGGLAESGRVGTLYLKDPAAIARDFQQRLAAFFTDAPANAPRLVCGSHRTAAEEAAAGRLLPEFHTQLSTLEIRIPPLRERAADLPRVVARLLEWVAEPNPPPAVDAGFVQVAAAYPWPGNLRELRTILTDAVAAAGTGPLKREHLPWDLRVRAGLAGEPPASPGLKLDDVLAAVEKRLIRLALRKANGNATKAAALLGIWRARILRRIDATGPE